MSHSLTGSDTPVPHPSIESATPVPHPTTESDTPLPRLSTESATPVPHPSTESDTPLLRPSTESATPVPHPSTGSDTPMPRPSIGSDSQVPKTTEGDVNHPSSETGSDLFVAESREFYIPHKYVIRESAQTTKMRIVYDASARATPEAPSLNDCLYTGPPLQNKIWDILVQQRTYPVGVAADIKQAFLQIRVKESERNALKFH